MSPTLKMTTALLLFSASAAVPAQPAADATQMFSEGKRIYDAQCAICHAADGRGRLPHYPPLIGVNPSVDPVRMVLNGGYPPGTRQNPVPHGMPPFAQSLSDAEVASVVTYIRTAWGNRGAPVSPREANALRAAARSEVSR
jgi:mono/diheme cytochrome c family protein